MITNLKKHLHDLNKKNKILIEKFFLEKIKGGAGDQVLKKSKNLRQQKFLADKVAGTSQNRPIKNFGLK